MNTFRNLIIKGNKTDLQKFKDNIKQYLSRDWTYKYNQNFKENFIVLEYVGTSLDNASIFIYTKDMQKGEFEVTNIVPSNKNNLNYYEYNQILIECLNTCIKPCADAYNLVCELSNEEVELEDFMSHISAEKLRLFSACANKSTGSSHPLDSERWQDFICQVFVDEDSHVLSILGRWLREEEGWDDDNTTGLLIEFEQGISLLSHYRNRNYE